VFFFQPCRCEPIGRESEGRAFKRSDRVLAREEYRGDRRSGVLKKKKEDRIDVVVGL
jgi:hypothetical protein